MKLSIKLMTRATLSARAKRVRRGVRIVAAFACVALLAALATAVRVRAADDAPAPANVAGTWQFTADSPQGTFNATLEIQQDGGTIKGTQKSDFGDSPITGTIKGTAIQFSVVVNSPNGAFTVDHDGTVTGDAMKGTFKINDSTGSWSATRQPPK